MCIKLKISKHPKKGFELKFQYIWKPKEAKGLKRYRLLAWALKLLGLN